MNGTTRDVGGRPDLKTHGGAGFLWGVGMDRRQRATRDVDQGGEIGKMKWREGGWKCGSDEKVGGN